MLPSVEVQSQGVAEPRESRDGGRERHRCERRMEIRCMVADLRFEISDFKGDPEAGLGRASRSADGLIQDFRELI
jgi:hypothetical protein